MLKIDKLNKHFRGVHALRDVSMQVDAGTVLGVVGDNGAGKSTLMKCVAGVLNPDGGSILFNGMNLSRADPTMARTAGIEMIYQDLALCKLQDAVTNVFLGREKRKYLWLDRGFMVANCRQAFTELEIEIPINSAVGSLSGGQQQSIAIARAMLSNPRLLIMDEPTAALSIKETQKVLEHMTKLKSRGVAVVVITHALSDILKVADKILVMRQGEIKHELTPAQTDIKDLTVKILGG